MIDPLSSFEVHKIINMSLFGFDISITNSSVFMMIATVCIIVLMFFGTNRKNTLVPNKLQFIVEELFVITGSIVKMNIKNKAIVFFPYMFSLFMFIMFGNILGLFPFAFSFTSQLIVTLGMAIIVFTASIIIGFKSQGLRYFRHFCPEGIPIYIAPFFTVIELMSFLFRPISLGVRLFANMVSGHIMIKVMASFALSITSINMISYMSVIPIVINALLNIFKLIVCILQAYVFVVLSCIYISESVEGQTSENY